MALIRISEGQVHSASDNDLLELRKHRRKFQLLGKSDICVKYQCNKCKFGRFGCKCYCHSIYLGRNRNNNYK